MKRADLTQQVGERLVSPRRDREEGAERVADGPASRS